MNSPKTYAQMRNEFYEKYQKEIVPAVSVYEKERKIKLALALFCSGIIFIAGIFITYYLITNDGGSDSLNIIFFIFAGAFGVYYLFKKSFENKLKAKIMPVLAKTFEQLSWSHGKYKDKDLFTNACLIDSYTSASFDDIFRGKNNDVDFEIIESRFTKRSGKNEITVFSGAIVKLKMNKNFTGHTIIRPDSFTHKSPSSKLWHTTLEDVSFEKRYDVFTNDEVEARYLITPSFMERLNKIKVAFGSESLNCAFYQDCLLIALWSDKDLFAIGSLFKPVDDAKQYFTMYEEIVSIVKLIDYFKLNQKIGL